MDENLTPQENTTTTQNNSDVLINMENMIKSYISNIDKLKEEVSKHQGLLNDIFENDATYKEHSEAAKEAGRIKNATKQQILKQPQAADLDDKVKSLKSELKENEGSLSDYLSEFQRMSGITEIEGEDGEIREIVLTPKLVKRSAKYPG